MNRALSSGDLLKVAALLECGLAVTYHVKECKDLAELAVFSIGQSELCKSGEKRNTDTFPAFAAKCKMILDSKTQSLDAERGTIRGPGNRMGWLNEAGAAVVVVVVALY